MVGILSPAQLFFTLPLHSCGTAVTLEQARLSLEKDRMSMEQRRLEMEQYRFNREREREHLAYSEKIDKERSVETPRN